MLLHLFVPDLFLGIAIYLGMFRDLVGERWLVVGAVWLLLLTYLAILYSPRFASGQADTRPLVLKAAYWALDLGIVAALLYTKYYTTTAVYIAACICLSLIHERKGFPLRRAEHRRTHSQMDRQQGV